MTNPVLVEVTRGERVESRHRGAVAIRDADGGAVLRARRRRGAGLSALGREGASRRCRWWRAARPTPSASAPRELALAQASHGGEPAHVEGVAGDARGDRPRRDGARMRRAHAEPRRLRGGADPRAAKRRASCTTIAPASTPISSRVARHLGIDHRGYVAARHPVQEAVREALESLTGAAHDADHCGTDGCSIPTYAVPLAALARGFARFAHRRRPVAGRAPRRRGASTRRPSPSPSTSPAPAASAPR